MPDKSREQKAAEADVEAFRDPLDPFVVATQTTRMAMAFTDALDPDNPIIFANESFLRLTGLARDDVLGQGLLGLLGRGCDAEALAAVTAAFNDDAANEPEVSYERRDGTKFWALVFVSPVRDKSGAVVQHFVSLMDGTVRKEEQVRCKVLIDELNHRVKNTLATVQSIVTQTVKQSSDPEAIKEGINSRLFALSRSHDLLTAEKWEGVGLRELIEGTLAPFKGTADQAPRFSLNGEDLRLPPKTTLALGIALHELATNALKHGALSEPAGFVTIVWTIEAVQTEERLVLNWRESSGPPVVTPTKRGFGSQILERGLAFELEGDVQMEYRPEGLSCTIDVPLHKEAVFA